MMNSSFKSLRKRLALATMQSAPCPAGLQDQRELFRELFKDGFGKEAIRDNQPSIVSSSIRIPILTPNTKLSTFRPTRDSCFSCQ